MPRHPRIFLAGHPHHIVQRGHDRQPVFAAESDYLFYLVSVQKRQRIDR